MEIAFSQIDITALRLLFSPTLIGASAAVWLFLATGAAGNFVSRVEAISHTLRTTAELRTPTHGTAVTDSTPPTEPRQDQLLRNQPQPVEHHKFEWRNPMCTRSQPRIAITEQTPPLSTPWRGPIPGPSGWVRCRQARDLTAKRSHPASSGVGQVLDSHMTLMFDEVAACPAQPRRW